uniref:uncharacterized protein LOC122591427 n=1 Tax=Erigeron canadensis TaxID=72917 RepID=UPI001CB894D4|nr:uncharacterized protein LOC122591427 [Erigeron canadensis]
MVGSGKMEMITGKGCSKMYTDVTCTLGTNSLKDHHQPPRHSTSNSPFYGLVICVTGLSKEARKQVIDATEKLGGQFSSHLHPHSHGRKPEHVLKHGARDGLFVVTLGWFVDSVRRNVRLNESLYGVKSYKENYMVKDDINNIGTGSSCLPVAMLENVKQSNLIQRSRLDPLEEQKRSSVFSRQTFYLDPDLSAELRNKVVDAVLREGAIVTNRWLVGQDTAYVVCEVSFVRKYFGHSNSIVTPQWVLKTVKETRPQRLIHLSADLARHVGTMLGDDQGGTDRKVSNKADVSQDTHNFITKSDHKENQRIAILAKEGVRNRRGHHMEECQTLIKPLARSILLDSISWIMSEPSSTASITMDSFSLNDANESMKEPSDCFVNLLRPLSEREKSELVFGNHFITILFPVDRFAEMGPVSRTFFSHTGFTCSQLLDHIYAFYQENMSTSEIELAIHTDSRHADRLRSMYSSKDAMEYGFVVVKRVDFLGSHRIFKMLRRVPGNYSNKVYELLTQA